LRTLAATLHVALLERGMTIATAESLTGGALGDLLSSTPGASGTYVGGVISYATEVKQRLLGVAESTINEHGVVSAMCAEEMARGVRDLLGADIGVSTTGVAGPTTQEGKPVGMVFVGVAGPDGAQAHELQLNGDRAAIRALACLGSVRRLLERIDDWTAPGAVPSDE
jgi:nicotinamide-nucleotide amidase